MYDPHRRRPKLAAEVGLEEGGALLVKDEGRLPTGSFKARGLVMAVSMAKELGVTRMAMPTNGNAGAAMSAYCSRCGIETYIFAPEDTPDTNIREMALQGANVWRVNGYIDDCGKIVGGGKEEMNWFDTSTLKEPYRIEGKKTMGLELVEQFGWDDLPDVIMYPTGGGTGLIGMWKAFGELKELGLIKPETKLPKMVAVQATGCAPMVNAYDAGEEFATRVDNAFTRSAMGIRVPAAVGDFLILRAVRESGGWAVAVTDDAIDEGQTEFAKKEGFLLCPRRRDLRRVQEGTRGRQDQEDGPRAAVQLRHRPEISHAPVQQRHRQAPAHRLRGDCQGYLKFVESRRTSVYE